MNILRQRKLPFNKFSYFQSLSQHMKIRKELIRDNKKIKQQLYKYALPFNQRWNEAIMNNKKKTIALIAMICLFQYYDLFVLSYDQMRNREPFNKKLKRWFLGEKNLIPPTIKEQIKHSKLNDQTVDQLQLFFKFVESKFPQGVNRRYLYTIYNDLNLFNKAEEKVTFYRQSGYYKPVYRLQNKIYIQRNQKLSGVNCTAFITLFEEALRKLRKTDSRLSEQDLLKKFFDVGLDKIDENQKWLIKNERKRQEYKKLLPYLQDNKDKAIRSIIRNNPYSTLDEMDRQLLERGLVGCSLKDKIIIIFNQKKLHEAILDSYKIKLQKQYQKYYIFKSKIRNFGSSKEIRLKEKVKDFEGKIAVYESTLNQLNEEFKEIFKKHELFPLITHQNM